MMDNIIKAYLHGKTVCKTAPVYQYNNGMVMELVGADLPANYRADFSNSEHGTSKSVLGAGTTVSVPYEYFIPGSIIHCWIVLSGDDYTVTKLHIMIPVDGRAKPTEEAPDPEEQGIVEQAIAALNSASESVQEALDTVGETVDAALQEAKDSGEFDGEDGVSPVATVAQTDTGATITVTDAQGTTSANILNGKDGDPGDPGISPTVTVTDIEGGHRITITDATGAHSFDVMNGEDGQGAVQDVQVNGVSVLTNGVANVPRATGNSLGVVMPSDGLVMSSAGNGKILLNPASSLQVKGGLKTNFAIDPAHQHESTFYGLAKAAGDTTQSASNNAVGTYTESAKSAISEMLNGAVSVSSTTPVINALPGVQYVCGEVATLEIILPESGIIDVVFESGTTATVLTVTPPTGMTVEWANGFDSTSLEADTLYELNIKMVGTKCLGVAGSWT